MIQIMSTQPEESIYLTIGQTLVGEPLPDVHLVPQKWWAKLQSASIQYIWIGQDEETCQNRRVSNITTKIKIWHEAKLYMNMKWKRRKNQVTTGGITEDEACYLFHFNFRDCEKVYTMHQGELIFACLPPEPDQALYSFWLQVMRIQVAMVGIECQFCMVQLIPSPTYTCALLMDIVWWAWEIVWSSLSIALGRFVSVCVWLWPISGGPHQFGWLLMVSLALSPLGARPPCTALISLSVYKVHLSKRK